VIGGGASTVGGTAGTGAGGGTGAGSGGGAGLGGVVGGALRPGALSAARAFEGAAAGFGNASRPAVMGVAARTTIIDAASRRAGQLP